MSIRDLQIELEFMRREMPLVAEGRKRMIRRTVQASWQRDVLIEALRSVIATGDLAPARDLLAEVDGQRGPWAPMTTTERAFTYRNWAPPVSD